MSSHSQLTGPRNCPTWGVSEEMLKDDSLTQSLYSSSYTMSNTLGRKEGGREGRREGRKVGLPALIEDEEETIQKKWILFLMLSV